jgi:hypothetical protein
MYIGGFFAALYRLLCPGLPLRAAIQDLRFHWLESTFSCNLKSPVAQSPNFLDSREWWKVPEISLED